MRKISYGLLISLLVVLVSSCSRQENSKKIAGTKETTEKRLTINNEAYLNKALELFKEAELITNERDMDIKVAEGKNYEKAKVIKVFDIEEKSTESNMINQTSNNMLGGLLLEFSEAKDFIELIQMKQQTVYFDDMGVDDNFISPWFFSNNERLIVLQLNNQISKTKVKAFETLLASIGEPLEPLTDWQLVETVIGEWSGDEGLTMIELDGGLFSLNKEPLSIVGTKAATISAHKTTDEKARYEFRVTDKGVTLLPSYRVEKTNEGRTGSDLAPIELVKQKYQVITLKDMLGEWQSVEADQLAFIRIEATDSTNQLDLFIAQRRGEVVDPIRLKVKQANDTGSYLQFMNQDETFIYEFGYSGNTHWTLDSWTDNPETITQGQHFILERSP